MPNITKSAKLWRQGNVLSDHQQSLPARFKCTVIRSSLYIARGSLVFSPILKAVVGATGLSSKSCCSKALFRACCTSVRTCMTRGMLFTISLNILYTALVLVQQNPVRQKACRHAVLSPAGPFCSKRHSSLPTEHTCPSKSASSSPHQSLLALCHDTWI